MTKAILTGTYFAQGCWALAEGAIAAGCRFFAGYPITPSTEIAERMARRLPEVGGAFIQMEDELASMAAIIGGSYSGVKSMTATSGPGFSLMQENIGLAAMTEAPCVVVDVMRGGPSSGQPTMPAQGDVMQAKWGSHGDYEIIAIAPSSAQEMFDLTVKAFNLSEQFRVPVIILADEILSHIREKVVIHEGVQVVDRKKPKVPQDEYKPFEPDEDLVPPMACFGEGYRFFVSGITHSPNGYLVPTDPKVHAALVNRLCDKICKNADRIIELQEIMTEDADIIAVAYGSPSRSVLRAVRDARNKGIKAGLVRLITLWPFPHKKIEDLARKAKVFVVAEMNRGQILREVERAVRPSPVFFVPKLGGECHTSDEILAAIVEASKC